MLRGIASSSMCELRSHVRRKDVCNLETFSVEESYALTLANVQAAASRRMAADCIE